MTNMESLRFDSDHHFKLTALLSDYRTRTQFCDVTLKVGDKEFPAHRMVLSMFSPYFEIMFNGSFPESRQKEVELHGLDPDAFEHILDYMYSGQARIKDGLVIQLYQTVDFLQMQWLKTELRYYLRETVNVENCVSIMKLAELYDLQEVKREAREFLANNLSHVSKTPDFAELDIDDVAPLLDYRKPTQQENEKIFRAIMRWLKHDPEGRASYTTQLLKLVHAHCIGGSFLRKEVLDDSLFKINADASDWLLQNFPNKYPHNTGVKRIKHLYTLDHSSELFGFDADLEKFTRLSNLPALQGYNPVTYKDSIYLFGGVKNQWAFKYDVPNNEWDTIEFPTYSSSEGICVLRDSVFFTGGLYNGTWYNTLCQYDFNGNSVHKYQKPWMERSHHGVASHGSCVYVCAGTTSRNVPLCISERMDIREGFWSMLPPMKYFHGYCHTVTVSDTIYCTSVDTGETERFDFRICKWETVTAAPGELGTIVACNNRLYQIHCDGIAEFCSETNTWTNVVEHSFYFPSAVSFKN